MASLILKVKFAILCVLVYCSVVMVNYKRTSSINDRSKDLTDSEKKLTKKGNILPPHDIDSEASPEVKVTEYDEERSESEVTDRQKCQAMFTVDKGGQIWTDDGPYTRLSHQLPPLMERAKLSATEPLHSVSHGTRLSLTNGSVSYLPCKVRQYSALDLGSCSAKRSTQGKRTWIAFVGDSNGRQKIHSFLTFLPPDLDYVYFLGDRQVSRDCFLTFVNDNRYRPPSYDIVGRLKKGKKEKKGKEEKEGKGEDEKREKKEKKEKREKREKKEEKEEKEEEKEKRENMEKKEKNQKEKKEEEKEKRENMEKKQREEDEKKEREGDEKKEREGEEKKEEKKEKEEKTEKEKDEEEEEKKKKITDAENPFDQGIFRENKTWLASPDFTFSMFPLHDSDPALEPYDLRVTLVWAPYASFTAPPGPTYRMRVTKFEEWLEQEVVPDVVVMGLGTWFLLQRQGLDELAPYTEAEFLLRPLVELLARLARRTRVLWWHQSRYRWFNLEGGGGTPWEDMLTHNQFRDSIPFTDAWLWLAVFRNTGMWQWDSTVPFNLANHRECYELWKLGLSKDKIYKSRWWHCGDDHHSSYETNADEIQMLLNLLCNAYIASREQYCCSGG